MSMNEILVPKRRFKVFTADWKQGRLGNYAKILTGGTPSTSISKYWNPKKIPWMSSGEINKRRLEQTDNMISEEGLKNSSARWIKENSILIALAGQGKTRGTVAVNNIPLTTNQSIAAIIPGKLLYYEFVFQNLIKRYNELRLISSGDGTRGGLNKQIVSDVNIPIPHIEEQKKIGEFFANLDKLIDSQQRKLNKTKAMKSAYLSEMFPAVGECKPKRRFAGFTGDWKQCKLRDLAESFEYGLNAAATKYDGTHKYIRITDIDDSSRELKVDALTTPDTDLKLANNYQLKKGDILFARTGASVGKTYRYNIKDGLVYYAGFLIRARINPEFDSEFVFQNTLTSQYDKYIRIVSQRSGQPGVNAQEYSDFNLMVPKLDEQKKIGQFLSNLDSLINSQQQKLEKLQDMKKAYLNEMFI